MPFPMWRGLVPAIDRHVSIARQKNVLVDDETQTLIEKGKLFQNAKYT